MTNKERFIEFVKGCSNDGMTVFVKIDGNQSIEEIYNEPIDVKVKAEYYDKIYDDNMKHKHAPVKITSVQKGRVGTINFNDLKYAINFF